MWSRSNLTGSLIGLSIISTRQVMAMTTVCYAIGYYLVRHPLLEKRTLYFGCVVFPFVLIGLGIIHIIKCFFVIAWSCDTLKETYTIASGYPWHSSLS